MTHVNFTTSGVALTDTQVARIEERRHDAEFVEYLKTKKQ